MCGVHQGWNQLPVAMLSKPGLLLIVEVLILNMAVSKNIFEEKLSLHTWGGFRLCCHGCHQLNAVLKSNKQRVNFFNTLPCIRTFLRNSMDQNRLSIECQEYQCLE